MISNPKHKNRLAFEKSPYLLQHATNPVDWYPWGPEAFKKARDEDKPIFLSIGYATCHWCHVMEKESFEDEEIAALMNETFVNIKIDREELPEIDNLYMEFAQTMMAGAAGWPLNIMLTQDLQPFFSSTYLPPHDKPGMMGLSSLIQKISTVWNSEERIKIADQAHRLVQHFSDHVLTDGEELPEPARVDELADILYKVSDPVWGGLKGSPKFPIGYQSVFLIRYYVSSQDSRALFLAERTLDMMQRGGIYDHIGGGFSRYSVDEEWFQPHFEKMLYDNALLIDAYLEAYQATRKPIYRQVVEQIADYVLEDMTSPQGGFFAAEDADSQGIEGLFYTWKMEEIIDLLGETEGRIFCEFYGVTPEGNFEEVELDDKNFVTNILYIKVRVPEFAEEQGLDAALVEELLREGRSKLYEARKKRIRPFRDDKVLSAWNGLMIHSLASAGNILGEARYRKAAIKGARFIYENLWKDEKLYRRFREGESRFSAGLDEYAFLIRGLLTLFEVGGGTEWLAWAFELNQILESDFKSQDGAYFQADGEDPYLLIRKCLYSDGAEPSGNAVQCENLLRFAALTLDESYETDAADILRAVSDYIDNYPPGYAYHLMNLSRFYNKEAPSIVVALNGCRDQEQKIRDTIKHIYNPLKTVLFKVENDGLLQKLLPAQMSYVPLGDKTTLYICRKGVCEKPLTEEVDIQEAILKLSQTV